MVDRVEYSNLLMEPNANVGRHSPTKAGISIGGSPAAGISYGRLRTSNARSEKIVKIVYGLRKTLLERYLRIPLQDVPGQRDIRPAFLRIVLW